MLLDLPGTKHINTVTHEGKVIIVATAVADGKVGLWYTVKQDGFEDSAVAADSQGWEKAKQLKLPNDLAGDPSVEEKEAEASLDKGGTPAPFAVKSRYRTAELTAEAPAQLISHDGHVYVFRQSTEHSLLVDRFVFDGITNELKPKIEVRFKRSHQRHKPLSVGKIDFNSSATLDSLDFKDDKGSFFFEPTTELSSTPGFEKGWFGVAIAPSNELNLFRWQIFDVSDAKTGVVRLTSVRAGKERIFDVQDFWARKVDPVTHKASYVSIPGIIRREIALKSQDGGAPCSITNGLAAIKYDVQSEHQTESGPQLVVDTSKILLSVPTEQGMAALSLPIGADGCLAEISGEPTPQTLRSQSRELLLPLDLLDNIKEVGSEQPLPQGQIARVSRSKDNGTADRLEVHVTDPKALAQLAAQDVVKLDKTAGFDGLYHVSASRKEAQWFEVARPHEAPIHDGGGHSLGTHDDGKKLPTHDNAGGTPSNDGAGPPPKTLQVDLSSANPKMQPGDDGQHEEREYENETGDDSDYPGEGDPEVIESIKSVGSAHGGAAQAGADKVSINTAAVTRRAYVAASITVPTVDGTTQTSESHGLGEWEKVSGTAPTGQIFPGKITGYSSTEGGLKIEAYQHELDKGKQVQVVGTRTYDGEYTVLQVKKETGSFVVQRSWADSEAVDVIADQVKRRRGLVLDGKHDWLECPFAKRQNLSQGFTLETWVKRVGEIDGVLMSSGPGAIGVNADEFGGMRVLLGVRGGRLYCALHPYRFDGFVSVTPLELVADATSTIASNEWVHVACIYDGRKLALVHNGKEIQVLRAKDMAVYARRIVEGDRTKLDEMVKDELRIRRTMLIQDSTLVKFPKHHPRFYDAVRLVVGENVLSQEKDGFVAVPESERLNQRWKVEQQDGGLFTIRNLQTKQNLAYHYYDPSNVLQLDDKWNLKLNQDDTYDLVSQHGENLLSLTRQGTLIFTTPGAAATGPASNPTSWRIKPYGDSRLQLLRRTIKAADARSKSSKAYFPVKSLVLAANVERQSSPGVMGPADRLFDGQMAEARFWKIARTAKDIENAQHLQLGGHEPGLAGYWRLGGVSIDGDGKRKTVFDFSSNTNHAIVHGAPYAGAREVLRAFGSAKTPTAWLTNAGLFAVREGGEYEEYFEFKPDNKIDINGEKPFKPSVWGRLTAQSENIYFKDPEPPENYTFADIGEGWYSARIRFTIPQGVRLLRLFELKDLQGEWKKLELRRPRLTIDWDKVTCATAQEKALLKALPGEEDCGQQLDELESLEKQEDVLIHRRNELKHLIQLAEAPKDDVALKAAHEAIKNQKGIIAPLQTQYDEEGKDPRFNWTCLKLDKPDGKYLTAYNNLRMFPYGPYPDQLWRFEPSGKGDDSYFMSCKHEDLVGRVLDGHGEDSLGRQPYMYPGKYNSGNATWEMWKLVKSQSNPNAWRIENCYNRNVLAADANVDDSKVCMWPASDQDNQRWLAVPYERIPEYSKCKNKLDEQNRNLKDLEKQYNPLFEAERLSDEGLANLKSELGSVEQKLKTLNAQLGPKHTTYLAAPAGIGGTREMMELADQHDRHGLKVTGAILPFVKPGMPLYAHESCTGRVGITYQDTRFNLRTVSYNSVFDSDGRGEEWLPSSQGGSLMVRNPLPLPASVFNTVSGQVTIEFWARNVSTEAKRNVVLCASGPGDARLTIALPHHPDDELMWEAGAPRVNAEPGLPKDRDSLKFPVGAGKAYWGWTHWAFVKDAGRGVMQVYANGVLVHQNTPTAKPEDGGQVLTQPIGQFQKVTLGGLPGEPGSRWEGQLAELRIWNFALSKLEIRAHRAQTLTGHEPGLVAYYPFNEGTGTLARDQTGTPGRGLELPAAPAATWNAFTGPMGRIGEAPLALLKNPKTFKGTPEDFIKLPELDLDFSKGMTIEAKVKFEELGTNVFGLNGGQYEKIGLFSDSQGEGQLVMDGGTWPTKSSFPKGEYVHVAVTIEQYGTTNLYIDGVLKYSPPKQYLPNIKRTRDIFIGKSDSGSKTTFKGEMEYVRIHRLALDATQIKRLAEGGSVAPDLITPISGLISTEYSRIFVDAQKKTSSMMKRCKAWPSPAGIRVLDELRVEELELQWIGNAQVKPTLVGYIEGAPPVPSENLTEEKKDYDSAASVELGQDSEAEFSWEREDESGKGKSVKGFLGFTHEDALGVAYMKKFSHVKAGAKADYDDSSGAKNASKVSVSHGVKNLDSLSLRGNRETEPKFPHLGKRYIPKNVGYALVISGLADVYINRVKRSGRMINCIQRPIDDVPLDVNTISFMLNPAYTMAGSLDGMTGSRAADERFFGHVPKMRNQFGALYPASYYRLQEAYKLKEQIAKTDKEHEAYFQHFKSSELAEGYYNAALSAGSEEKSVEYQQIEYEIGWRLNKITANDTEIYNINNFLFSKKPGEGRVKTLENENAKLQGEVDNVWRPKKQALDTIEQDKKKKGAAAREKQIREKFEDVSARANAEEGLKSWQKKMEGLQVLAGKHNMVNTYVWDCNGGWHAEEQQFASSFEHNIGGNFERNWGVGAEADFEVASVGVEFEGMATFKMTQTTNKSDRRSSAMDLKVELKEVESGGITDQRDIPLVPGEKVSRYRFMTFFLEGAEQHWNDFFDTVVDPEWLQSNAEGARALRQTQAANANKTWRVFHRVTYVERPAMMGFGRTQSKVEADEIQELREQVTKFEEKSTKFMKAAVKKLDITDVTFEEAKKE